MFNGWRMTDTWAGYSRLLGQGRAERISLFISPLTESRVAANPQTSNLPSIPAELRVVGIETSCTQSLVGGAYSRVDQSKHFPSTYASDTPRWSAPALA